MADSIVQSMAHYIWNASMVLARHLDTGFVPEVAGKVVVELGAGLGLPGLVAASKAARKVVLTEYPDAGILECLRKNCAENAPNCRVAGHAWGQSVEQVCQAMGQPHAEILLLADCIWMVEMHQALLASCRRLLSPGGGGRVYMTCFPHTGRTNVDKFLTAAKGYGFQVHTWQTSPFLEAIEFRDSDGTEQCIPADVLNAVQSFQLALGN